METSSAAGQRRRVTPFVPKRRRPAPTCGTYAARACHECRPRRAKCDGGKLPYLRSQSDDQQGTASTSIVCFLKSRIKAIEQVLRTHSINLDASIADLEAGGAIASGGAHGAPTSLDLEQMCAEFRCGAMLR